jgi:glycerophosphoryl diester phosphodiesterase
VTRRPLVVAHRGGSPTDLDNSLAAFEHALAIGAHLMECDLRLSSDGVVVLHHDERLEGRTIPDFTLAELRERIPTLITLDELLDRVARHDTRGRFTFDLKQRGIERQLAHALRERGLTRDTLVTTQHAPSLRRLARSFPGLRLGLSRGQTASGIRPRLLRRPTAALLRPIIFAWLLPQLRWSRATAVALQHRLVTPAIVRRFNHAGIRVYAWTVDDCAEAQRLARCGVDMLATNVPQDVLACLGWTDSAGLKR